MITEDHVSFKTAKLLKEKGFDWIVSRSFFEHDNFYAPCDPSEVPRKDAIAIPTLQMAMKWLREKHFIIAVTPLWFHADGKCVGWAFDLWADDNLEVEAESQSYMLSTYEEACEAAIKYCLENLI